MSTTNLTANLELVNPAFGLPFANAAENDVAIYPQTSNQSIHLGTATGATTDSMLKVTRSNVEIAGDIEFTGALTQNGVPFQSGTPGLSNDGSNLFVITGSNLGIGTSNPQALLHVAGDTRIDGDIGLLNQKINVNGLLITQRQSPGAVQNITSTVTSIPSLSSNNDSLSLVMAPGQSNIQFLNSNNETVASIDGSRGDLVLGASSSYSPGNISAGNLGMFRNRIINGDMRIDQRNGSGTTGAGGQTGSYLTYKVQPSSFYTVDRFAVAAPNIATVTAKQVELAESDIEALDGNFTTAVQLGLLPNDSLAMYLPMDGDLTDVSGNGVTATTVGTMQYVPACAVGTNALYLANEANVLATPTRASNYLYAPYTQTTAVTVSCWICLTKLPQTTSRNSTYWSFVDSARNVPGLYLYSAYATATTATLAAAFHNVSVTPSFTITDKTWYHTTVVYVPGTSITLYVDGVNVGALTASVPSSFDNGPSGAANSFVLFGDIANSGSFIFPFAGFIDDFRIYDRALSAGEIAAFATNVGVPASPANTNFFAHLTFDGTTADARGGLPAPTTMETTVLYTPVCKTGTRAYDLMANNAAGAANSTAASALTYSLTSGSFAMPLTLAGWFQSRITGTTQVIFALGNNTGSNSESLQIYQNTSSLLLFTANVAGIIYFVVTSFTITPGMWYHVALAIDSASYMNCYVNGIIVGSRAIPLGVFDTNNGIAASSPTQLRVGAQTGSNFGYNFKGLIDDVRIYNRVLSSQEIAGLYTSSQQAAYTLFRQTIEGNNLSDLAWGTARAQPVTASMWIKNNTPTPQQFSISAANGGATLIAWMPFEDGSVEDAMGFLTSSATRGTAAITTGTFKVGTAALDLTGNTINAAPTTTVDYNIPYGLQTPLSISFWFNASSLGTTNVPLSLSVGVASEITGSVFSLELVVGSTAIYASIYPAGAGLSISKTMTVSSSRWYHVCVSISESAATLYIDGLLGATNSTIENRAITNTTFTSAPMSVLRLGGLYGKQSYAFKGFIDDVRIYNAALSSTQVAQLYTNNANSTTPSTYLMPRSLICNTPAIPANSWQKISFTIPGDTVAAVRKSWQTDADAGLTLAVCLGATSMYNSTNVAIASGNISPSAWTSNTRAFMGSDVQRYGGSSNNLLANVANSVYITGVQLEKGYMMTPFEFRPQPIEMQLCQRYYQIPLYDTWFRRYISNTDRHPFPLIVMMRALPIYSLLIKTGIGGSTTVHGNAHTGYLETIVTGNGIGVLDLQNVYVFANAEI